MIVFSLKSMQECMHASLLLAPKYVHVSKNKMAVAGEKNQSNAFLKKSFPVPSRVTFLRIN